MARYIDKDDLFTYVGSIKPENQQQDEDIRIFLKIITDTPTEDVKPIVSGEWIYLYDFDGLEICECNKCGVSQEFDGGIFDVNSRRNNFCPNCGADMRKQKARKNNE